MLTEHITINQKLLHAPQCLEYWLPTGLVLPSPPSCPSSPPRPLWHGLYSELLAQSREEDRAAVIPLGS